MSVPVSQFIPPSSPLAAAAAKLRQLCPTLCDPIDGSLPGSSIPGIFQARAIEWGGIFLAVYKELSLNGAKEKESVSLPLHLHY